jgi:protein-S-isoprenylcysteine O-methyltransferase Ste14
MNEQHRITDRKAGCESALSDARAGNHRSGWITRRAFPFCIWIVFLVVVLFSLTADAQKVSYGRLSLQTVLPAAREILTAAFMLLVAASYLVRIGATEPARGFWERRFPMWVFVTSMAGMALLHSHPASPPVYVAETGLVFALLGACLSIWSVWHLRGSFSILAEARRTVVSGPYRYIRHPLYLGEMLNMLGICLMIGTGTALLFWLVISAWQLARARIEEKKLSVALPDYRSYRSNTPFIVPGALTRLR